MGSVTRGIHTKPNKGESVDWLTPLDVITALGEFDLDPCAYPGHPTAKKMVCLPSDGLKNQWQGRVWLNPPYGNRVIEVWIERLSAHGNGIALVPSRTEVSRWFWPFIWERADAVFFFRGRIWFKRPDGSKAGNAGHGSVLAAYGEANVKAIASSGLKGRLVRL